VREVGLERRVLNKVMLLERCGERVSMCRSVKIQLSAGEDLREHFEDLYIAERK